MNFGLLAQHFANDATPLLRTDFSNDAAWEMVVRAVTRYAQFGTAGGTDDYGPYTPNIEAISDRAFEGASGELLADASDGEAFGYVLLADDRAMSEATSGADLTVVYVDLSVRPDDTADFGDVLGREFRCEVDEIASIEANLSIANMDFAEFADSVGEDGVFRGFPE